MTGEPRAVIGVAARRRFFAAIVTHLRGSLPEELRRFTHRGDFNLMKIWWDNPRVHFEDGPASTIAYLRALDERVVELKHDLGYHVELERWTTSWGRLYELLPLEAIDETSAKQIGRRVEQLIATLQPIVIVAAVPPERSANR